MQMTRDEFAHLYAERSGFRVVDLVRRGMRVVACGCGASGCNGWQALTGRFDLNVTDTEWAAAELWAAGVLRGK